MVKKTTTAKKITVRSGKPKKTVAAKATPKKAKITKKIIPAKKTTAKPKIKASLSKQPAKITAVKNPATPSSPVRKVEEIERKEGHFNSAWLLILIASILFIAGLGLWATRDADDGNYINAPTTDVDSGYSDFQQPSIRIIEN